MSRKMSTVVTTHVKCPLKVQAKYLGDLPQKSRKELEIFLRNLPLEEFPPPFTLSHNSHLLEVIKTDPSGETLAVLVLPSGERVDIRIWVSPRN